MKLSGKGVCIAAWRLCCLSLVSILEPVIEVIHALLRDIVSPQLLDKARQRSKPCEISQDLASIFFEISLPTTTGGGARCLVPPGVEVREWVFL